MGKAARLAWSDQERKKKTYVDGPETRTVTGGHVLVHGLDGVGAGHVAVLLVHVVGAGAGVVADPDAKVLDLLRALLMNLQARINMRSMKRKALQPIVDREGSGLLRLLCRSIVKKVPC